jgi:nucleoside-diphosphate-sugar epimerase
LGRSASPARSLPATVRYIAGDFNNPKLLQSLLAEHEEVIDLAYATVPNTSFSAPLHDLMQNLPVAVALFEAACAAQVRKVIIVSSGGTVYGEAQSLPISESHPTHPISPYGITKLTIDHYAQWFHAIHGLPVVCLRPGNAYGEGQLAFRGQGFVATAIASVIEERPIQLYGEEGAIRDYVHAEDIAAAIRGSDCAGIGAGYPWGNIQYWFWERTQQPRCDSGDKSVGCPPWEKRYRSVDRSTPLRCANEYFRCWQVSATDRMGAQHYVRSGTE